MSRAALRSALVLTGVTGLLGAGLLQAAVAGAAEPWQLSVEGTTATYTSVDTDSELSFLVPAGVTSLDVTVGSGEPGAEDAAPITQQIDVTPGSTLLMDFGADEELTPTVVPPPSDAVELAPSEDETAERTAPASWYVAGGDGAAASIRVADPADLVVGEQATRAAEDGEAVAQEPAEDDAPVSIEVSFVVPTPGVLPSELQAPEWLEPADAVSVDEPVVQAEVTGAEDPVPVEETDVAEDSVPAEPSVPNDPPAPADVHAQVETAVEVETTAPADAAEDAPAPEAPVVTEAPAAIETPAPVATVVPTATSVETIAAEPTAPAVVEAPAEVVPPQPTAPVASGSPEPTSGPRRVVPTPAPSPSAVAVELPGAAQPGDERFTVDLQTASSMATVDLFAVEGVGILAAGLAGVVVLGVGVTVTVGTRRRD